MSKVFITSAVRTAVGSFNGSLSGMPAHDLGTIVIKETLNRSGIEGGDVDEVILGQVLTAATGQNPARQASINAGLNKETPAWLVNQVCGSGLRSVALAYQSIMNGDANIIIAGGQESMSQSPHCMHLRNGTKMGDDKMIDSMIKDGLWDAFNGYHMGTTAENVAQQWQITRDQQDEFAFNSQQKASKAKADGVFKDEIVPVEVPSRKETVVFDSDEYIKDNVQLEKISSLRPAFAKEGTVTAANASGINDGAAALAVMSSDEMKKRNLEPMARIVSWSSAGVDPSVMGTGPIPASRKALDKAGWDVSDLDLIESNEAFAAQSCAVNKEMGWDVSKVNVNGGAIAIGQEKIMSKVALVTGGTRGIGAAISLALKKEGCNVAATYSSNSDAANKFSSENGIEVFQWNVADAAACEAGVKQVADKLGTVDILVNNAGISKASMAHKMSVEQWDDVIRTDLDSVFYMTRCVLEGMREKSFGRIISISSINGQKGEMGLINYSAAKAGLLGFTKALAQETARKNITVNAIAPGYIDTEILADASEDFMKSLIGKIPVGRLGTVDEVSRIVTFLASDEAGFITGSTISANGGQYFT